MRRFVEGMDRGQSTLFPECLEDWLDEDNAVRVIDVFVDELDLRKLGFGGVDPEITGRPSYHPSVLLKLYIYGYLNRVQSSRRLEREASRNVEVMWLLGRLAPDHKTIADFRKDNGRAIRQVCARFLELCRIMGLLTEASVAIDGSKFKAVNNRDKNFTRAKMERRMAQIEESVARYLHQLDTADRQEPSEALKTKTGRLKEKIEKLKDEMRRLVGLQAVMLTTPDQQISLTDPDARSMATSGRGSGVVGYNVQVAVDIKHHLIVAHEVTNVGIDRSQLSPMAKAAKATLGGGEDRCRRRPRLLQWRRDPGLRECRHHGHTAQADDLQLKGGGALRQAGLPLHGRRGRLYLSCRQNAALPLHN
jgi:transposase